MAAAMYVVFFALPAQGDEPVTEEQLRETLREVDRVGEVLSDRIAAHLIERFTIYEIAADDDDDEHGSDHEQQVYAAFQWGEIISLPDFPTVEPMVSVHPAWTTSSPGQKRFHVAPTREYVASKLPNIPPWFDGWFFIDAEPWRGTQSDGSSYIWDWDEMFEYYETLVSHFRDIWPKAKLVPHGIPNVPLWLTENEKGSGDPEKFGPILSLFDAVGAAAYSSQPTHATNGGITRLNTVIDRAEVTAQSAGGLPVMMVHSSFIAGNHSDHPDAVNGTLFWTDEALKLRAAVIFERGHSLIYWHAGMNTEPLESLLEGFD